MWGLIINEFQKIMKNKKYLIIVLLFAALLSLFSFMFYQTSKNNSTDSAIKWNTTQVEILEKEKTEKGITDARKQQLDQRIKEINTELDRLKQQKALENEDWKAAMKQQLEQLKTEKEKVGVSGDNTRIEQLDGQIKEKEYSLEHGIKPSSSNSNAYIILLMSLLAVGALFLSAGIAAFMADVVSKEYTYPTIKLLLTKPVSRAKILLSKYIVSLVTSVGLIVLVEMVIFLVVGLLIGFGNASEGVTTGTRFVYDTMRPIPGGYELSAVLGSTHILPLWQVMLQIIGLECIYIIACVSFCFLLSTLTRNNMAAMTAGIISTIALNIFMMVLMTQGGSSISLINKIVPLLFISYGNVVQLVGLEQPLSAALKIPQLTPVFGIGVCLVWAVVCYAIAHISFVKRDNLA